MSDDVEKAILAGGCFWGMEDLFRKRPGVISTRVGYTGGDVPNATYRNHGTHAEAIEIVFNPEQTSDPELLEFFSQIHDSTTLNRQLPYGRAIARQSSISMSSSAASPKRRSPTSTPRGWPGKVVTEVTPAEPFWEAEPEHQNYLSETRTATPAISFARTGFRRTNRTGRGLGTSRTLRPFPICRVLVLRLSLLHTEIPSDYEVDDRLGICPGLSTFANRKTRWTHRRS